MVSVQLGMKYSVVDLCLQWDLCMSQSILHLRVCGLDPHKESCQTFCTHLLRVAVVAFLFVHHLSLCWDCRKVTNNAYVIVVALWPGIFLPIGERNSSILR
ncbi:unnamed protein product [Brassica rapa subsp. trilocularis]